MILVMTLGQVNEVDRATRASGVSSNFWEEESLSKALARLGGPEVLIAWDRDVPQELVGPQAPRMYPRSRRIHLSDFIWVEWHPKDKSWEVHHATISDIMK